MSEFFENATAEQIDAVMRMQNENAAQQATISRLREELAEARERRCENCKWATSETAMDKHFQATKDECKKLRKELEIERVVRKTVAADLRKQVKELAEADANIEQLEKELFDLRVSEDFHYARMIDAERQKQ